MKKNVFILSILALMAFSCDTEPITTTESDNELSSTAAKASVNATYEYLSFSSAMASNGHTMYVESDNYPSFFIDGVTGGNTLSVHPKSVQGSGIFEHRDQNNDLVASGTWTATKLLSYKNYGPAGDPNFPFADGRAGFANIRIHLMADGGAEFDAILFIRCLLPENYSTPPSWVEGIRINVQNALNFNKTVPGGGTLFLDLN